MQWRGKEIKDLSDDALSDAIFQVSDMDKFRVDKLAQAKKRHKNLFAKHSATENPRFTQLATELNNEFKRRKLKNV